MQNIIKIFKALGDTNRLRLVNILLLRGELCVCDLQAILDLPQTRVSRHLALLNAAGLVKSRRKSALILYRINDAPGDFAKRLLRFLKSTLKMNEKLANDLQEFDHLAQKGKLTSHKPGGHCNSR